MIDAPRTTNLNLTEDQERELVDYCLDRWKSLQRDNFQRIEADKFAQHAYDNSRDDRKAANSVWEQSNLVLPFTAMIVDSFTSRTEDELFQESPYFSFKPQGRNDDQTARDCDAYFRYKFGERQGRIKDTLVDGILAAFIRRSAVYKVIWEDDSAEWLDQEVKILFDKKANAPVRVIDPQSGDARYVDQHEAQWDDTQEAGPNGTTILKSALRADPSVVWSEDDYEYRPPPAALLRDGVRYRGAKPVLLDSDCFLAPSTAESLQKSDITAETYDKPLAWVRSRFLPRAWMDWRSFRAAYLHESAKDKSQTERAKDSKENLDFDRGTKTLQILEFWVRRDVLGWGRPQEFMVQIEPTKKKAIYYEFQANLCPDLQRPYREVTLARHKNYWWGYNLPERLKQYQDYIDKQFNRHSVRNARNANPIGVINPDVVEEEPDDIELGDGGLFHGKTPQTRADQLISFASVPKLDLDTKELLDFVMYLVQLWLSVSNLAQGDYGDLPQNSTKFGIQATLREASKLGRRWIRRIKSGYEDLVLKLVKLQCDQLDQAEVFEVTDGAAASLGTMTPELLRRLEVSVQIVLSQAATDTEIKAAEMAIQVVQQYMATPPQMQAAVRPMYVQILEALDFKDVDRSLPVPPPMPPTLPPGAPVDGGAQTTMPGQVVPMTAPAGGAAA